MVRDECFDLLQAGAARVEKIPADDLHVTTAVPVTGLSSTLAPVATKFVYGATALAVGVESLGVPFPGETALVTAAIYAGATHQLSIFVIVGAASTGAFLGGAIGFWIGREFGLKLLLRHGARIGMTPRRIKLGQYLFLRHGGKVVFFGRFIAVLRSLAALLAGANRMAWPRFMMFNALGAVVWASLYGVAAFHFGKAVQHLAWPLAVAMGGSAMLVLVLAFLFIRRHETRLEAEAERALPGATASSPEHGNG
jgi:membrane protein DedA with SNARE-associated domain